MTYISDFHGCVYRLVRDLDSDGDYLIYTPLNEDGTYSENDEDWVEVDDLAFLGEEKVHQDHIEFVYNTLGA